MCCVVSLQAPQTNQESRAPVDIVAVIDRSGSMQGQKLDLVKQSLGFVQRQLLPQDRLCIVTYDNHVRTELALTNMDPKGKESAKAAVAAIRPGGSTNLSGGLLRGIEEIAARTEGAERPASVLLFTDGLANCGIRNTSEIVAAEENSLAVLNSAASIFTFGFGHDHNDSMLQALALGGGLYYFIENAEKIPHAFADCLGGLLSLATQNTQVTITAKNGTRIEKVHSKRPCTESRPSEQFVVELGDMYCDESRDLVLTVRVPALTEPQAGDWELLTCGIKYFNVLDTSPEEAQTTLTIERPAECSQADLDFEDEIVAEHWCRVEAARALAEANELGRQGKYARSQEVLDGVYSQLQQYKTTPLLSQLSADLMECRGGYDSESTYHQWGCKMTSNRCEENFMQRSCQGSASKAYFRTPMKRMMLESLDESLDEQLECAQPASISTNTTGSLSKYNSIHAEKSVQAKKGCVVC